MVFLAWAEVAALANAHSERYRTLIYVAVDFGMRWSELVGLRRARVDLRNRKVRVTEQLIRLEAGEWVRKEPKTPASVRSITISPFTAGLLAHHLDHYAEPGLDALVFLNEAGHPLISSSFWNNHVRRAQRRAGVICRRPPCVGNGLQLPAVGRGGMFAYWAEHLPAVHLERLHRFTEAWEAQASLALRAGDPEAAEAYAAHDRLSAAHPTLLAERVAHRNQRLTEAGDTVATRKNERCLPDAAGGFVRNRQTWMLSEVRPDSSLLVSDPERRRVLLPAEYVTHHVELGWAVTGCGNQGVTVDHGICVVEAGTSRPGAYVGLTRGRRTNTALGPGTDGLTDPAEMLAGVIRRPGNGLTAHAVRDRLRGPAVAQAVEDAARMIARLDQLQSQPPPARRLVRR